MCDFISIAGVVLSIAQAGVGYMAAQAQYEQQAEEKRQNDINAARATEQQYRNLNIRAQQEALAAHQQGQEANIEAARAVATTKAAAAEGNVGGLAVSHVLQDLYSQKGRHDAALDTNIRMSRAYIQGEKKAAEAGGQNQINSMPVPEKPSFAPYLLQAFSGGLNAYSNYRQRKYG